MYKKREEGTIQVWNDGKGIPVHMHSEHKMYIPEMIFGHLLTSSNYDDKQKKVTGSFYLSYYIKETEKLTVIGIKHTFQKLTMISQRKLQTIMFSL